MMDDKVVLNNIGETPQDAILADTTQGMTEIALGYEYSRCLGNTRFTFRGGYEWQNWFNYSSAFTPVTTTPPGNPPASFAGPADVGFGGFTLMAGIER